MKRNATRPQFLRRGRAGPLAQPPKKLPLRGRQVSGGRRCGCSFQSFAHVVLVPELGPLASAQRMECPVCGPALVEHDDAGLCERPAVVMDEELPWAEVEERLVVSDVFSENLHGLGFY